jgi:hypothetical protein
MWLFKFCWRPNRGLSLGQWVSEEKHQWGTMNGQFACQTVWRSNVCSTPWIRGSMNSKSIMSAHQHPGYFLHGRFFEHKETMR